VAVDNDDAVVDDDAVDDDAVDDDDIVAGFRKTMIYNYLYFLMISLPVRQVSCPKHVKNNTS
jgi:hypothetical protein